ncbi:LysR family transcriptional regulator [Epibacterium sp. SM1979]|uniref:LysR family transcriptional regulator n=1 Tax=Tritonibacter litoralis TaxID=2662264 RepID=A0A843YLE2_9RHOB|nr:LysR family transcriptional regulator [Tritonibacter litoralis]MQQ10475.1 LysR family transcriptional regulator [Tritonibacter litoralis]
MALKIEMLRCFAAVAQSGNLSDAARTLGRTPSAISMMLKQLETHLGEPLFETDRKSKLTALGDFVLEQAERELKQFDDTVRTIEGYAKATLGHVRIAAVPSVAGSIITQVFARHINEFSHVDIELRDMDSSSIIRELSKDRVDIGVATLGEQNFGLHSQFLLADTFGVICSEKHPLAFETGPIDWEKLEGERLIANSLSKGIDADQSRALHAKALLTAQNLTSLTAMVRAGIGITILPEMAIQALHSSGFAFRPLANPIAKRPIHLLRKAGVTLSPSAQIMERHIFNYVQETMKQS